MLPGGATLIGRSAANVGLDRVERRDAGERLRCDRRRAGRSDLVEPATDMRPAEGELYLAGFRKRTIAGVAIDLQRTMEALEMSGGTLGFAIRAVK